MNILVPIVPNVDAVVRLIHIMHHVHEKTFIPLIYHITNLEHTPSYNQEQNTDNVLQICNMLLDKNSKKLVHYDSNHKKHYNILVESLPIEEEDLNKNNITKEEKIIALLMRCADICTTLNIQHIAWPSNHMDILQQWKHQDMISKKISIIFVPSFCDKDLIELWNRDKSIINKEDQEINESNVSHFFRNLYFDPTAPSIFEIFNLSEE